MINAFLFLPFLVELSLLDYSLLELSYSIFQRNFKKEFESVGVRNRPDCSNGQVRPDSPADNVRADSKYYILSKYKMNLLF